MIISVLAISSASLRNLRSPGNPTPHAIAVYASRPLSPVAPQHSLPSGRYSLTWAGLAPAGSHQLAAGAPIRSPRGRVQQ